ncbi:MAG: cation transporter [Alistipes sp.]|nr:cation transporter [Alistipes sp.]
MQNNTTDIRTKQIYRVTLLGMFVNMALLAFKLVAGIVGRSGAMVADAVHSASDFATDIVVLAFMKLSSKPKDACHKYGHGKYETVASIIIALALGAVGVGICIDGAEKIAAVVRGEQIARPEFIALIAAVVSIAVKEWLYRYTVKVGDKTESSAVVANAWHHRSDALSSVGTLIGIGCAYVLGGVWTIADPIAAIVVAAMILKVAIDLLRKGFDELVDGSLPADVEEEIVRIITEDAAISHPHNLRTRRIGSTIAIEVHIRVDGDMSVRESHSLTESIERRLRERFGAGTIVSIHVEPIKII